MPSTIARLTFTIGLVLAATALLSSGAWADNPNENRTLVEECDHLPSAASIEVFDKAETLAVCQEMARILDGATISDLRGFSKTAFMLSVKGYRTGEYSGIVRELVDIIRLRGLSNSETRWYSTNNLIWRLWIAEKGLISPRTIREFLASAGPDLAKSMTDDALLTTMITLAVAHKNGVDLDEPNR